jgi:RNA polymerase sigma factor (TIGR02999 family)
MDAGGRTDITQLIRAWQLGDRGAEHVLFEALYGRLHQIAEHCLRSEAGADSLGPTALVHEAYLRFANGANLAIVDRNHFLALAARVMRRIIVDRARARKSQKRGGDQPKSNLDDNIGGLGQDPDEIIQIDIALDQLQKRSERQARLVELRYFGGFSIEETAAVLGVSTRTARREWQVARLRLKLAIDGATSI